MPISPTEAAATQRVTTEVAGPQALFKRLVSRTGDEPRCHDIAPLIELATPSSDKLTFLVRDCVGRGRTAARRERAAVLGCAPRTKERTLPISFLHVGFGTPMRFGNAPNVRGTLDDAMSRRYRLASLRRLEQK